MYIDIFEESNAELPFHIIMGARGCGKTFSGFRGVANLRPEVFSMPRGKNFMLIRRLDDDCETIASDTTGRQNPFLTINRKYGTDISLKKIGRHKWGFFPDSDFDDEPIGYMTALTTIGKVRGGGAFDDTVIVIGDEFVPEINVRKLAGEGKLWMSAYDSIARNRETEGLPPVQMFWLSNSDDIHNELLAYLGVVNDIERLVRKQGYGTITYRERGLEVKLLAADEEYITQREASAIGKLAAGTQYGDMAIYNKFSYNDFSLCIRRNIKQCSPMFAIDNIYIWRHDSGWYYACYARGDVMYYYDSSNMHDRMAIQRGWRMEFMQSYMRGKFYFETYAIKHMLIDIIINNTNTKI